MISKWITDLNVRYKTIKLLECIIGENFHDLALGKELLNREIHKITKIDKVESIKM